MYINIHSYRCRYIYEISNTQKQKQLAGKTNIRYSTKQRDIHTQTQTRTLTNTHISSLITEIHIYTNKYPHADTDTCTMQIHVDQP